MRRAVVKCHGEYVGDIALLPDVGARVTTVPLRRSAKRRLHRELSRHRRAFMAGQFPATLGEGYTIEEMGERE
ncbi:MAG: hypothetical protein ACE5H8_16035 [Alphaproteobacteria bacterium]